MQENQEEVKIETKETSEVRKIENPSDITGSSNNSEEILSRERPVSISKRELASLKLNNYDKIEKQFKDSFVIRNNKTGLIVELKAASSYHACKIIGWRAKNCTVLDVSSIEELKAKQENKEEKKELEQ